MPLASTKRARARPLPEDRPYPGLIDFARPSSPSFPREILIGLAEVGEALLGVAAGLAALTFWPAPEPAKFYLLIGLIVLSPAINAFGHRRLYSIPAFCEPVSALTRLAIRWAAALITLYALFHWLAPDIAPRGRFMASWGLAALAAMTIGRLGFYALVTRLAKAGRLERRVAVVGSGDFAEGLVRDLAEAHPAELRLLGVFDDRGDERAPKMVGGLPKLGNVDDLVAFARTSRVDLIIFALPITAEARILEMLRKLWVLPIDVRLAAHANRLKLRPRAYSYIGKAPMLDVFDKPLAEWDIVIKAAFDRIIGALALIALSPVMLAAAIAVKLDSHGSDAVQAEALRLQQRTDRGLQIPLDARRSTGPCRRRNWSPATIRASRASAASCAAPRSTNCRNCSTSCSRAICRWSGLARTPCTPRPPTGSTTKWSKAISRATA